MAAVAAAAAVTDEKWEVVDTAEEDERGGWPSTVKQISFIFR
jgi:hypothetical protein